MVNFSFVVKSEIYESIKNSEVLLITKILPDFRQTGHSSDVAYD